MPVPRVKIDVFDKEGNKITVTLKGNITREKVLHVLDLVELLGGVSDSETQIPHRVAELTKFDKMKMLIEREFPIGWFSSQRIQTAYEESFNEPIGLSTVSTYLSRLARQGLLVRKGTLSKRLYRLKRSTSLTEQSIKF